MRTICSFSGILKGSLGPICLFGVLTFFLFTPTFAQETIPLSELGQSRQSIDRMIEPADGRGKGSAIRLNLKEQRYSSPGQTGNQRNEYSMLGVDLDLRTDGKDVRAGLHGIYQGVMQSAQEQYIGLPEFYVGESRKEAGFRVTVGRQLRKWSYFDEEFGMGVWQPQLRWDYLEPIQQGLTGVFFDYQWGSTAITFFTSPIFLPDQGPNFRLRNGDFESQNRWFWKPQTSLQVINQKSPLSYELQTPKLEDVVFHSSLGGNVRYQKRGTPYWVQGSYALKPMNQLNVGFECDQCVGSNLDVQARIHPSVLMHRVVTAEAGIEGEFQRGWVSVTRDEPLSPKGPANWLRSPHTNVTYAGASYAHALALFSKPGWVKLSYMRAFEQKRAQPNTFVDERVESSLDRFPYQEISALELNWQLSSKVGSRWSLRTRYTYSIPERGSWLSTHVYWQNYEWVWNLGVDVLGAEIDPLSPNAGLFSRYRANDRASAGVTYAF